MDSNNSSLPRASDTASTTLRALAEMRGMSVGAAVGVTYLRTDPLYGQLLAREFNLVTPENELKFEHVCPRRGRYDFTDAEAIVAFATTHQMRVRGHTLVWHLRIPEWVPEGAWTRAEALALLREHIQTVVGHFRGQIFTWDVVNEALDDEGELADSFWLRVIGPEYIELAFQWAHEADPQARLFYNEWGADGLNLKSDAMHAFVESLVKRGVPIHGVGLQMHISLGDSEWVGSPPTPEEVAANMRRFAGLGLELHVTEMDIQIQDGTGTIEERLASQGRLFGEIFEQALTIPRFKALVVWGVSDRYSWIPQFSGKPDAPLIFDDSYHPKPAYDVLEEALLLA